VVGREVIAASGMLNTASYVLPLRRAGSPAGREFGGYLAWLAERLDLIVVDGSAPDVFDAHAGAWAGIALRHVRPEPGIDVLNGKVAGVLTGLRLARCERVVVADDDVRYDDESLRRVIGLLDDADLVRPQNFFDPCPWHARWDTARTLLNRAGGGDYPGTLAVRRAALPHGYDGDVLFENLELIRTVRAGGGRMVTPLDCYVRRLPCSARHFWSQRVRQAYDDLAQPPRLVVALSVVPTTLRWAARRQGLRIAAAAGITMAVAEAGRRRAGGRRVFPAASSLFAPVWLAERGLCSWVAVSHRLLRGGCPYHGAVIRRAASSSRRLRRRSAESTPASGDQSDQREAQADSGQRPAVARSGSG
jgi:hypothetical protein